MEPQEPFGSEPRYPRYPRDPRLGAFYTPPFDVSAYPTITVSITESDDTTTWGVPEGPPTPRRRKRKPDRRGPAESRDAAAGEEPRGGALGPEER